MNTSIYQNIATRTAGDIYIGVVGPVRTGKSTFIKRFMETQVIPNIDNVYRKERARDELPQSGSGRTIMTAEPKFVPEEAAQIQLEDGAAFSVRLIDCVGYMVKGRHRPDGGRRPRMVTTPGTTTRSPMTEAAEIGTRKVIAEHSTIGIVITTDGTITDIPREDYLEAEERVIRELQELGKPFIVLLNSADPRGDRAQAIAKDITSRYEVNCMAVNCLELDEDGRDRHPEGGALRVPHAGAGPVPAPLGGRPAGGPPHQGRPVRRHPAGHRPAPPHPGGGGRHRCPGGVRAHQRGQGHRHRPGHRRGRHGWPCPGSCSTKTLSEQSGFSVGDDGDLMSLLTQLAAVKAEYDKVAGALKDVRGDRLRHRGARHRRAEAGGAGDHEAGRPVRRAAEGQRPPNPHDPGGH